MDNLNELVTLKERIHIAQHCVEEMGKTVKMKVLNMTKAVEYMREIRKMKGLAPFVVVKPVIEQQYKEQRLNATYQRDPKTGVYYGIPVREDEFGNIIWRKVRVVETETYRIMDSIDDAMMWTVLRFHPKLKNSPFQMSNPPFEVFDQVADAKKDVSKANSMKKAFEVIDKISEKPSDMLNFVRYMGEEITDYTTIAIIEGQLNSLAMHDPVRFLRKYNEPARAYHQIFTAAMQLGLIGEIPGQGYYYNNTPLGMDETDVVSFLKNDQVTLTAIIGDIEQTDEALKAIVKESIKEPAKAK